MSGQHRPGPPDECASCCGLFSVLALHHQAQQGVPLTVAALAEKCQLKSRTVQIHLGHLVAHGRVGEDRRTPVPGVTVGPTGELPDDVTPLDWVVSVNVKCRTCRRILTVLATVSRGSWRGQISMADLAVRIEVSEHTARMHTRTGHTAKGRIGHSLVGDGLVAFVADGSIVGRGPKGRTQYVRRPDRFILWPTEHREPAGVRMGETWGQDRAAQMLDAIQWFDPTHPQAAWVLRLVESRMQEGWTEREVIVRLDVKPRTEMPLRRPYLFAKRRLDGPLPPRPTPEVLPVGAAVRGAAIIRPRCRSCDVPFAGGRTSADGLCRECREELTLPLAPVVRVEPRRCHGCSRQVGPAQWLCDGCGADQRLPA